MKLESLRVDTNTVSRHTPEEAPKVRDDRLALFDPCLDARLLEK
jgi:hypothetical protein